MTSQIHSPLSSIFFAHIDTYVAAGEEAALNSFAPSQLWTVINSSIHCAHRDASYIPKYRENSEHAINAVPFVRICIQNLLSQPNCSHRRTNCTLCCFKSSSTNCNDGTLSMSSSCFTLHARMKASSQITCVTSSWQYSYVVSYSQRFNTVDDTILWSPKCCHIDTNVSLRVSDTCDIPSTRVSQSIPNNLPRRNHRRFISQCQTTNGNGPIL